MLNSVILVGRVGQNPEVKFYESGKVFATFNIAVDRVVKKSEGKVTDWFRIEMWGKLAETANEYVRKGHLILIQGRLEIKKWEDEFGNTKESAYIVANTFRLLGSKQEEINYDQDNNY